MTKTMARAALVSGLLTLLLAFAPSAAHLVSAQSTGGGMTGVAQLIGKDGKAVGTALFTETGSGVRVNVQISGATVEGAAQHGIHIHQTAMCVEPDFSSAGEHFNPTASEHGPNNSDGPHVGDLLNITINADGSASYDETSTLFTLSPGERSIFDTDGSAIVIHENPDDYVTGPSGKSGGRIACGVIVPQDQAVIVGMPRTGSGGGESALPWLVLLGLALTMGGACATVMATAKSRKTVRVEEKL